MSYRLIDANAIAESYPEVNDMPCIYADLPRGLDGGHYDMRKPNKLQRENAKLRNEVDNLLDFEHLTSVAVAYAGCDECGEYKQTMLHLFAENAKLQEYITRLEQANIVLDSDNCDLRNDMRDMQFFITENRKLRALLIDAFVEFVQPYGDAEAVCEYSNRMRKLGVEVDR